MSEETFPVTIGKIHHTFTTTPVRANDILTIGGATPVDEFVLEATKGESGHVEAQFVADQLVDLRAYKHFRIVPRGGSRS